MAFVSPLHSRTDVKRAGEWLAADDQSPGELMRGTAILTNWRAAHGYPLNTFQATLRNKLKRLNKEPPLVGQRLKRAPSVIAKLRRFPTMKLHQMQDIAGLRAIVGSLPKLQKLHENYLDSNFSHELVKTHNYVVNPKADGYRSIHLVYRYKNPSAPEYDGLHVELQLRTQLQHAWATAVETVDAYLGQQIKAGRPGEQWANFFKLASAAFSHIERSPWIQELDGVPLPQLLNWLSESEQELGVLMRLRGFSVATSQIIKSGHPSASYHLIVLNTEQRNLTIRSFAIAEQERANREYAALELRARNGEPLDPVLITGGSVEQLRKAYPNYFLDTDVFVRRIERVLKHGV